MKLFGFVICFFFCVIFVESNAQTAIQRNQFELADSLGQNFQFAPAQAILDTLLEYLSTSNVDETAFRFEILALKAHLYEGNNENDKALSIALNLVLESEKLQFAKTAFLGNLTLALLYEKNNNLKKCKKHLDKANKIYLDSDSLDYLYGMYCIRTASYFRFNKQLDSAIYYAKIAVDKANKYNDDDWLVSDSHLILGILLGDSLPIESINNFLIVVKVFKEHHKVEAAAGMYNNISNIYFEIDSISKSFLYNDSAFWMYQFIEKPIYSYIYFQKAKLFERIDNSDSALFYTKKYIANYKKELEEKNSLELEIISETFSNEQNEIIINNQKTVNTHQRNILYFLLSLIGLISLFLITIAIGLRNIKQKNLRLNEQAVTLEFSVNQKEILLAEVQHRVKNNLQLIIGLLEIQKDYHANKSIEEITLENQERIEALAKLYDKLYISDNLSKIDFKEYISDVTMILERSYKSNKLKIEYVLNIESIDLGIEKSIPIGLILVELINNSLKHGFKGRSNGQIAIETKNSENEKYEYVLIYKDNGIGVEKNTILVQGTGSEIMYGLVKQMKGEINVNYSNGFKAELHF